jgi:hypothetical protein
MMSNPVVLETDRDSFIPTHSAPDLCLSLFRYYASGFTTGGMI